MISIPLFLTAAHDCSYLGDKTAQSVFTHPSFAMSADIYAQLIAQGFRRSGDDVYAPYCQECQSCLPARIACEQFIATRTQKRCWQKNINTTAIIKAAEFEQAHYEMYLRYQQSRHAEGQMAHSSPEEYIGFLSSSWCDTLFVEFHINNELAGVAIVDVLTDAFSAVYTFFEPKFSEYSLGTYAVLWQIEQARQQQRTFVYLGFWIKDCQKMNYKSHYHPLQLLINKQWQVL
jgi:arginine-tRNA-protein transferase